MELTRLEVIEHADFSAEEAWIIFGKDAAQVPHELRDTLCFPCVLTGNAVLAKRHLALLQAINASALATTARDRARAPQSVFARSG